MQFHKSISIVAATLGVVTAAAVAWTISRQRNIGTPGSANSRATEVGSTEKVGSVMYPRIDDSERLSVPETLGLAFFRGVHGVSGSLYARANPEAKPWLYRIVRNRTASSNNAWLIIGHIGDESDIREIRYEIEHTFDVEPESDTIKRFNSLFAALQFLALRRVPGALEYLDEMTDPKYWSGIRARVVSDEQFEKRPGETVRGAFAALFAYAFASGEGVEERAARVAENCDVPAARKEILDPELPTRRRRQAESVVRAIAKKPAQAEIDLFSRLFNGDYENPGPNWEKLHDEFVAAADARAKARLPHDNRVIRDPGNAELKAAVEEAEDVVGEIHELFRRGDVEAIRPRVLKDSSHEFTPRERIDDDKVRAVVRRLEALYKIETTPEKPVLETWKVWSDKANAEITNLRIEYRLPGTEAIGREIQAAPVKDAVPRHTVDRDGALKVVMIREDGVWRWNPFGW